MRTETASPATEPFKVLYVEIGKTFKSLDEMRIKRLQLLPLISGASIVTLLLEIDQESPLFLPLGIFGALITLGLFCYEARCVQQCSALIEAGQQLETYQFKNVRGQFLAFPPSRVSRHGPQVAASLIYSSVIGGWIGLAFYSFRHHGAFWVALALPMLVAFAVFCFILKPSTMTGPTTDKEWADYLCDVMARLDKLDERTQKDAASLRQHVDEVQESLRHLIGYLSG